MPQIVLALAEDTSSVALQPEDVYMDIYAIYSRENCVSKTEWLRDSLHELRRFAKDEGLDTADDALRIAIIRIACEQDIPTKLPARDLALGPEPQTALPGKRKR